jgi:hypothetical protein
MRRPAGLVGQAQPFSCETSQVFSSGKWRTRIRTTAGTRTSPCGITESSGMSRKLKTSRELALAARAERAGAAPERNAVGWRLLQKSNRA